MQAASKLNILVVDDEPKNLVAVREILDAPDRNLVLARKAVRAEK